MRAAVARLSALLAGGSHGRRAAPALRTKRLQLQPFGAGDAAALHRLFTDPGVRRWLLDDKVVSRDWVEAEIEASRASFRERGCGLWALRLADGATSAAASAAGPDDAADGGIGRVAASPTRILGFAGFRPFHEPPRLELLYGLHPDVWGRGLATEAAAEVMRHGFETLGFERIRASTDASNEASIRVMERLGMRFEAREEHAGLDTVLYALDRAEWRGARARDDAAPAGAGTRDDATPEAGGP